MRERRVLPVWTTVLLSTTSVLVGSLGLVLILGPTDIRFRLSACLVLGLLALTGLLIALRLRASSKH